MLPYADDLALMGNNIETVKQCSKKLIRVADKFDYKINNKNTDKEFLKVFKREHPSKRL